MLYQLPLAPTYHELSEPQLRAGIKRFKAELGERLVILGHHYQQHDVIEFADFRGDSLKLSQLAAEQTAAEYIVFCGVHFMAESADILTSDKQQVILPDLSAGCSMADMADIDDLEDAWEVLDAGGRRSDNHADHVRELISRGEGVCRPA
jgi:quinolinate synthase